MRAILAVVMVGLSGCGTTFDSIPEKLGKSQDWELCYSSIAGEYAYERELAGQMVRSRGVNCTDHLPMVQARMAARGASHDRSMQMLLLGNQISNQRPAAAAPVANRPVGFLKRQYMSGQNRICVYDQLGSEYAVTIGATSLCQLSLQ